LRTSSLNHRPWPFQTGLAACLLVVCGAWTVSAQTIDIATLAGYPGKGSADGANGSALFYNLQSVAVDAGGNLYVADTGNNTIRVVTSAGVSSTLAGNPGVTGSVDGSGSNALFNQPSGIALDAATNIYVTDYGNNTIRKVTLAGSVTTIAGTAGVAGSANLTGTNSTFNHPLGIAVDSTTNLYVADYGNQLIRKISASLTATTLAGSVGVAGFSNASSTSAQFNNPEAVTVDGSLNVYVADTGNAVIRKITSGGSVSTFAGTPGSLGTQDGASPLFYQPEGVVITSGGTLYVSDYYANTIRAVTSGGVSSTIAGSAGLSGSIDGTSNNARFWGPQGLAFSSAGTVYIADSGNSTVRTMTAAGVVTTLVGSPSVGSTNGTITTARFYSPQGVALDSSTNLYIADVQNHVIRKISISGAVTTLAGTVGVAGSEDGAGSSALFSGPQGLAVDSSGTVYVADTGNSTIRKINSGGTVSTFVGLSGNPGNTDGSGTNAQFNRPGGVAVDTSFNVYVADTWNHTIRKITPAGVSSTLAGLSGTFGTFNGTNSGARFNCPTGVAVDPSGNLYVTDFNNDTIREVTPAGVVTTLAGEPGTWGSADGSNSLALFNGPTGIAYSSGNLFVIDSWNNTLRKVAPSGTNWIVTTVAGLAGVGGSSNGIGTAAQFYYPQGLAVSSAGYLYVGDAGNNSIRSQGIPPFVITPPQSQSTLAGLTATFSVAVYGTSPFTYIWQYDGSNYAAGSSSSLVASNAGTYLVTVSNSIGQAISSSAVLTLTNLPAQPGVFSSFSVGANGIVHFSVTGTTNDTYSLLYSTNLRVWTNLYNFTMSNGAVMITDSNASSNNARFYKLVSP